ncbi:MAG: PEP-CTERM sorting domain-containing protein [Planctomycetota bacterium]|jgi:hypothetical protein
MKKFCVLGMLVCILSLAAYADLELGGINAVWGDSSVPMNMWEDEGMNMNQPTNGNPEEPFKYTMATETWDIADNCLVVLDLTYDLDPYVLGGLAVTNNAAVTQSFMFTFNAPVSPAITTATYYSGSVSGSYTVDATAGSVTTTGAMPLYMGRIDGVDTLGLHTAPQSWGVNAGDSGSIPVDEIPYLSAAGPVGVSSDIEIVIRFTLTPGETATLNGNFFVEPIPEPATMALLGLGAVLLGRRKR